MCVVPDGLMQRALPRGEGGVCAHTGTSTDTRPPLPPLPLSIPHHPSPPKPSLGMRSRRGAAHQPFLWAPAARAAQQQTHQEAAGQTPGQWERWEGCGGSFHPFPSRFPPLLLLDCGFSHQEGSAGTRNSKRKKTTDPMEQLEMVHLGGRGPTRRDRALVPCTPAPSWSKASTFPPSPLNNPLPPDSRIWLQEKEGGKIVTMPPPALASVCSPLPRPRRVFLSAPSRHGHVCILMRRGRLHQPPVRRRQSWGSAPCTLMPPTCQGDERMPPSCLQNPLKKSQQRS